MRTAFTPKMSETIYLTFLLVLLNLISPGAYAEDVNLGLLIAANRDRDIYLDLIDSMTKQHPDINFHYLATDDARYKTQVDDWLINKQVDVTFSPAGNALCRLANENKIAPLDQLWQTNGWGARFSNHIRQAVSCNGKVYGVPYGYYYWGIFYNKAVFKRLNLSPPKTWQELLETSATLKRNGISPFTIGTKNSWPAAGWFDYLNMRLNGLDFHKRLLAGELSYDSDPVRKVFKYWKQLITAQYFVKGHSALDWKQAMPFMYRGHAGMTLAGAYILNQLPKEVRSNIGFFRFPQLDANMPFYENVPIETFVLNRLSADNKAAANVLALVGKSDTQYWLAKALGYLSVYEAPKSETLSLVQNGIDTIKSAAGFAQYFDRDARQDTIQPALKVFKSFLEDSDSDKAIAQLEALRVSGSSENRH